MHRWDAAQTALFLTGMWDGMVIRQHFHAHDDQHALPAFFEMMIARLLTRESKLENPAKPPLQHKQIPLLRPMKPGSRLKRPTCASSA